jgi:hypothetical protein
MGKNTRQHWGFVNPVHLVNPVYTGLILLTYLPAHLKKLRVLRGSYSLRIFPDSLELSYT